jgi:hypothetical protein
VDECADIFALGVLLYEFVTGRVPFACDTLEQYLEEVDEQSYVPLGTDDSRVPNVLLEVIESWLRSASEERLSLDEGVQMLERGLHEDLFDDVEVELHCCLLDPKTYLDGLAGRMVAVLTGKALAALGRGERAEAAHEVECGLVWRPGDPKLMAFLQALPTADKDRVESLRREFAAPVEAPRPAAPAKKSAPAKGVRRWRRGIAVAAGLAVGAVGLLLLVHKTFDSPVQKAFAREVQLERPGPVQFTYRLLSEYRPYSLDGRRFQNPGRHFRTPGKGIQPTGRRVQTPGGCFNVRALSAKRGGHEGSRQGGGDGEGGLALTDARAAVSRPRTRPCPRAA